MAGQNVPQYWVPHKEHCWVPGTKKYTVGDSVAFDGEGCRQPINIPTQDAADLAVVLPDQLLGVEDIATLRLVNEAALLHTIRVRYVKGLVYTRVGRTVIATNPFTTLPIYDSHFVDQYAVAADSAELPAHIFSIGKDALEGLRLHRRNQAVLISGESGAGKTETAKLIMAFVADAVRCGGLDLDDAAEVPIEDKIVLTNPVLEAFGNAMTVRNHNSSRFGHWLDLRFSDDLALVGCSLAGYLLETMRVCNAAKHERSFHIFYQLIGARAQYPDLQMLDAKQYTYLKGGQVKAPGIDDNMCFIQLCEALVVLGFSDAQQSEIFKIVAGVLTLGNVDLEDSGDTSHSCRVQNQSVLEKVAGMLGVDIERLRKCITVKTIASQSESFQTPLRVEQGRAARDTLARLLYNRLFFYLVDCMNKTLYSNVDSSQPLPGGRCESEGTLLGILDIAGFESFEQNSLEQLLINLSNELLHQHFNEVIFSIEAEEAEKEGVEALTAVQFTDNTDILEFIDSRNGALDLLDETMALPGGTDAAFVTKVLKRHEKDKCLLTAKFDPMTFGIRHFAGEVFYSCEGWLDKNAESPPTGASDLLTSSKLDMLQHFGGQMKAEASLEDSLATKGARKKVKSVSSAFRTSLKALMTKIRKTDPHYVLCMKPNMEKVPKKFNANNVMHQLLLTGVLGAVQMRQKGYAHRIPHEDFVFEYQCIVDASSAGRAKAKPTRKDVDKLVDALPEILRKLGHTSVERTDFAVGATKVFFKDKAYKPLHESRCQSLSCSAAKIQRRFRIFVARQTVAIWRDIRDEIQNSLAPLDMDGVDLTSKDWPSGESILARLQSSVDEDSFDSLEETGTEIVESLEAVLFNAQAAGFKGLAVLQAESIFNRLQMELEVVEELEDAATSVDTVEIEKVLTRASKLKLPFKERLKTLETRLHRLRTQMPLKKAMERASILVARGPDNLKAEELEEVRETLNAIEEAGLSDEAETSSNSGVSDAKDKWVAELDAAKLFRSLRGIVSPIRTRIQTEFGGRHRGMSDNDDDDETEKRKRAGTAPASAVGYPTKEKGKGASKHVSINLSLEEQKELLRALKKAVDECDIETLEKLIAQAVEGGMDQDSDSEDSDASSFASSTESDDDENEKFSLKLARKALRRLQDGDYLMREMKRTQNEVRSSIEVAPVASLKKLEGLASQLGKMPGHEQDVAAANGFLQKTFLKLAKGKRVSVFDTQDPEELDLATKIFGNLSGFARLKPSRPWIVRLRQATAAGITQPPSPIKRGSTMQPTMSMPGAYRQSIIMRQPGSPIKRGSTMQHTSPGHSMGHTKTMPTRQAGGNRQSTMMQKTASMGRQGHLGAYRQSILGPSRILQHRGGNFTGLAVSTKRMSQRSNETTTTKATTVMEDTNSNEAMMSHGKVIIESLTWHADGFDELEYDAAATQNFRNILCAMGDRPAQECQRIGSRLAVVALARDDPRMHDEIYMQILKQLIHNTLPRSMGLGWELLYNLVKEVTPSDELIEFVRVFITQGLNQMEFSGVSYFYALRIARLLGCRGEFREGSMSKAPSMP